MFGPKPRLDLARKLAAGPDEATHRAAIHQAYYAVYHFCCAGIGRDPSDVAQAGHRRLLDDLLSRPGRDPWLVNAKRHLDALIRLRVWADYDDRRPILRAHAHEALQRAGHILD